MSAVSVEAKARAKASQIAWAKQNRAKINARKRELRRARGGLSDKERLHVKEYKKKYYQMHKVRLLAECKARSLRNRDRYSEQHRRSYLLRKYALTDDQYTAMEAAQQGLCAICGEKPNEVVRRGRLCVGRLCVDHDHVTGEIRALLCNECNAALGSVRDEVGIMCNAADYLERYNGIRSCLLVGVCP